MVGKRSPFSGEIRAYIKNRCILGIRPIDIFNELCRIYGKDELSYPSVFRWCKWFNTSLYALEDAPHARRPRSATGPKMVAKVKKMVANDARFSVKHIARCVCISTGAVHTILNRDLKMKRICARWVPHLLTKEQKLARVNLFKNC